MAEDETELLRRRLLEQENELFSLRHELSEVGAMRSHSSKMGNALSTSLQIPSGSSLRSSNASVPEDEELDRDDYSTTIRSLAQSWPAAGRSMHTETKAVGHASSLMRANIIEEHEDEDDGDGVGRMFTSAHATRLRRSSADQHFKEAEDVEAMLRARIEFLEQELEAADGGAMDRTNSSRTDDGGNVSMARRGTVRDWRQTAKDKDKHISDLMKDMEEYDMVIARQEKEGDDLKEQVGALEKQKLLQDKELKRLMREVDSAHKQLDTATNQFSELWRKSEGQRRELEEAKELLIHARSVEELERDQRQNDLTSRMKRRKSSVATMSWSLAKDMKMSDGDMDREKFEEEMELLRDELNEANELLTEALQAREESAKVEAALREELTASHRKLEAQMKVTENLADSERRLRGQLADVTSGASSRRSQRDGEVRLLMVQVASAEGELKAALELRDDAAASEEQAQPHFFSSTDELQQELLERDELLFAEQELRDHAFDAQHLLLERMAKMQDGAPDAEVVALGEKLQSVHNELQDTINGMCKVVDGDRVLRDQLGANCQLLREQFVERSGFFKIEEELREELAVYKEKLRERMTSPDSGLPVDQVLLILREHLEDLERQITETMTLRDQLQQSEAEVRTQLEMSNRRVQQLRVMRDEFSWREQSLNGILTATNMKLNTQAHEAKRDDYLREMQQQLSQAKEQHKSVRSIREQLVVGSADVRLMVEWTREKLRQQEKFYQALERNENDLREELKILRQRMKQPGASNEDSDEEVQRDRLNRAERQLRELLSQKENGETEAHLRARLASAHLQLKEQDVNVPVVSLRIPSLSGPDDAGGGSRAEASMTQTKTGEDRLRMRRELALIRAELRDVATAMLEDVDASKGGGDQPSWLDSWLGSAKRTVCCSSKMPSPPSSPSDRRRQLLLRLREHLAESHGDPEASRSSFDASSFESAP